MPMRAAEALKQRKDAAVAVLEKLAQEETGQVQAAALRILQEIREGA